MRRISRRMLETCLARRQNLLVDIGAVEALLSPPEFRVVDQVMDLQGLNDISSGAAPPSCVPDARHAARKSLRAGLDASATCPILKRSVLL